MTSLAGIDELIESRPDYREGRPHIAGTGVSVGRIGILWSQGFTVEEIADDYTLSLEQACAALAYYLHNRAAIDEDLRQQDEETDRIAEAYYREHGRLR
jgi:uncharacterized protein (DUF433 family)